MENRQSDVRENLIGKNGHETDRKEKVGVMDEKEKWKKSCNLCRRRYEKETVTEFIKSVCGIITAHTLFILLSWRLVYIRCRNHEVKGADCLVPASPFSDIQ